MLEMAQINCIRTLRQLEGKSISRLSRCTPLMVI